MGNYIVLGVETKRLILPCYVPVHRVNEAPCREPVLCQDAVWINKPIRECGDYFPKQG